MDIKSKLLKERLDLNIKIAALDEFTESDYFPLLSDRQINLILKQLTIMIEYSDILDTRIRNL